MSRPRTILAALLVLGALAAGATTLMAADARVQRYAVTVTNVTRGQILSPPLVISHNDRFRLFTPGQPASPELAALAEDADTSGLMALLGTMPDVFDYQLAAGPVPPGESRTIEVETHGRQSDITVAGMLVTTNDGFFAGTTSTVPRGMSSHFAAVAWDAGSEGNTESCEHIPGPPCMHPGVRMTETAEGFVHVHAGVHGIGDLDASQFDWRNPTAQVTVIRIR